MTRKPRFRNVGAGKGVKEKLSPEHLRELYHDRGLTQGEIARRYGCSPQFVSQLMQEYDIPAERRART